MHVTIQNIFSTMEGRFTASPLRTELRRVGSYKTMLGNICLPTVQKTVRDRVEVDCQWKPINEVCITGGRDGSVGCDNSS